MALFQFMCFKLGSRVQSITLSLETMKYPISIQQKRDEFLPIPPNLNQVFQWEEKSDSEFPAFKYMLKINNRNTQKTRNMFKVNNKDTRKMSWRHSDILLLSFNIFYTF